MLILRWTNPALPSCRLQNRYLNDTPTRIQHYLSVFRINGSPSLPPTITTLAFEELASFCGLDTLPLSSSLFIPSETIFWKSRYPVLRFSYVQLPASLFEHKLHTLAFLLCTEFLLDGISDFRGSCMFRKGVLSTTIPRDSTIFSVPPLFRWQVSLLQTCKEPWLHSLR